MSDSADLQQKISRIASLPNQNDRVKAYKELFQGGVATKKFNLVKELLDHCTQSI
jgi:hypothetical protein